MKVEYYTSKLSTLVFLFFAIVFHQKKSDVFFLFRTCKTLLFASHLDMKRPRAHAEPLLFSPIVHLKAAHFENGFLVGNIVKSEGFAPLPCVVQYPRVLFNNSPNYFQENRSEKGERVVTQTTLTKQRKR